MFLLLDYVRFSRHYQKMTNFTNANVESLEYLLEELALTPSEKSLSQQLVEIQQEKRLLEEQQQQNRQELMDYYTLWVHQIKTSIAASDLLINELPSIPQKIQLQQEQVMIKGYTDFVLHYLRMETFHRDLVLEREELNDLVKASVKKYAPFFIYKHLELDLQDCQYQVITDKKWFAVILEQVLSNAVKYTAEGGRIAIYLRGDYLCIEDTGIGISEADQSRIFERGFSGKNGRMNYYSSGLGLYLAKQIADKLGITLTVDSIKKQGTTIKISLKQQEFMMH
ncbi:sensor histidine kinase [Granulicatella balaenopterae]|uniref:sensor histidine kinase n=1 Tax=Granulicatella balaenopterae TaxID=137733 RepID=UPI001FE02A67|nr:sensor histidine kinase [Granulicatella balaenopterae]